tara:strand:- start:330 stop:563 length:234 start_codon:yes stop_codon:yes gene_type:complete
VSKDKCRSIKVLVHQVLEYLLVRKYIQERKNIRKMGKKYTQKPAVKPGAMILAELREQEIKNGDIKWNKDTQRYERN